MDRFDLIEVTTWTGLTVISLLCLGVLNRGDHMDRFDLIEVTTWTGLT